MRTVADLETDVPAADLFDAVRTLDGYDAWLDIVTRVAQDPGDDGPVPDDAASGSPAWSVDLRGQVGPLRRSKRLRMVRTVDRAPTAGVPGLVRYERRELDGREHSDWTLTAEVSPAGGHRSRLAMELHYGGSLWVPFMERMLRDEIERSRPRLLAHLQSR